MYIKRSGYQATLSHPRHDLLRRAVLDIDFYQPVQILVVFQLATIIKTVDKVEYVTDRRVLETHSQLCMAVFQCSIMVPEGPRGYVSTNRFHGRSASA